MPENAQASSPLKHETSISTPLLVIETKSIQASTIPEESSRANSEVNIHEKLKTEPQQTTQPTVIETDHRSSSQSSLPIINVSDAEETIHAEVVAVEENKEDEPKDEEEERCAEASIPEEQTLSRENIPGVIKKLSIQSEEQLLQELNPEKDDDEQDTPTDYAVSGGYVAPAPTPAPSMAPLAEVEADPEADEEPEMHQHVDAEVVQASTSGEHDAHHHKKRKKKKDAKGTEQPAKGNLVCPWEDE